MDAAANGAARGNGFHFPISTGDARMEEPAFRRLWSIVRSAVAFKQPAGFVHVSETGDDPMPGHAFSTD